MLAVVGRAAPGHRVVEPVGFALSARVTTQHSPGSGQNPVGSLHHCGCGVGWLRGRGLRAAAAIRTPAPAGVPRQSGRFAGRDLATCPDPATPGVQGAIDHLGWRHSA